MTANTCQSTSSNVKSFVKGSGGFVIQLRPEDFSDLTESPEVFVVKSLKDEIVASTLCQPVGEYP